MQFSVLQELLLRFPIEICPLALPDADWPETLLRLDPAMKQILGEHLQRHDLQIITAPVAAIQQQNFTEAAIAELLGISAPYSVQAFSENLQSIDAPSDYLAIRPVCLHAGRDHVVLREIQFAGLDRDDFQSLGSAIAPLFQDFGLRLEYNKPLASPNRWTLHSTGDATQTHPFFSLQSADAEQALGRNIDAYLAQGEAARQWRKLETEIQMTWFNHPVNQRLQSMGLADINSVWIDGLSSSSPAKPPHLDSLSSERDALQSLARHWKLKAASGNAGSLLIHDHWRGRLQGDALSWLDAWEKFITTVIAGNRKSTCLVLGGETTLLVLSPNTSNRNHQHSKSLGEKIRGLFGIASRTTTSNQAKTQQVLSMLGLLFKT